MEQYLDPTTLLYPQGQRLPLRGRSAVQDPLQESLDYFDQGAKEILSQPLGQGIDGSLPSVMRAQEIRNGARDACRMAIRDARWVFPFDTSQWALNILEAQIADLEGRELPPVPTDIRDRSIVAILFVLAREHVSVKSSPMVSLPRRRTDRPLNKAQVLRALSCRDLGLWVFLGPEEIDWIKDNVPDLMSLL